MKGIRDHEKELDAERKRRTNEYSAYNRIDSSNITQHESQESNKPLLKPKISPAKREEYYREPKDQR
jgi:hypothetical protein